MKLRIKLASFVAIFLLSAQVMADSWNEYLPANKPLKAKIMAVTMSKEENMLAKKLHDGLAKNEGWLREYIKDLKPGQEMPYHTNFGISKSEYLKYIRLVAHEKMKQIGSVDIVFQQESNNTIKIKTKQQSPINGLVISANSLETPLGKTTTFKKINQTNKTSPTGLWTGVQWSLFDFDEKLLEQQRFDEVIGKEVKLAVGKLAKSGEGILYYTTKDIDMPKHKRVNVTYVIYYPLAR